jgi:hypothetical protein
VDLKDVALWKVRDTMIEGVCELCHEPMRGPLCVGWAKVPEGRALVFCVTDETGAHPLRMVAERNIPVSFRYDT